jgi:benzoate-CoA ligase
MASAMRLTFPLSRSAPPTVLMAERPTPDATFNRLKGSVGGLRKPTAFFGAPTGFAGMLASPLLPGARSETSHPPGAPAAGEALPPEIGAAVPGVISAVEIVDGIGSTEMLHIFHVQPAQRRALWHHRLAGARLSTWSCVATMAARFRTAKPGDLYIGGPSASALMYWGNREKSRETFQGGWTKSGDKYVRNADGYLHLQRAAPTTCSRSAASTCRPFEVEATLDPAPARFWKPRSSVSRKMPKG